MSRVIVNDYPFPVPTEGQSEQVAEEYGKWALLRMTPIEPGRFKGQLVITATEQDGRPTQEVSAYNKHQTINLRCDRHGDNVTFTGIMSKQTPLFKQTNLREARQVTINLICRNSPYYSPNGFNGKHIWCSVFNGPNVLPGPKGDNLGQGTIPGDVVAIPDPYQVEAAVQIYSPCRNCNVILSFQLTFPIEVFERWVNYQMQ